MKEADIGTWERCNGDVLYLAFLTKLEKVTAEGDAAKIAKWSKAANTVPMSFKLQATEQAKLAKAYQLKESEEANADMLGHSLVSRARELSALQDCTISALRLGGREGRGVGLGGLCKRKKCLNEYLFFANLENM
jgi:hypothetical protein